jgi:hypothetical protein
MTQTGVTSSTGKSADLFASGMRKFWALDFAGARQDLEDAASTFPPHTLAAREADRAATLAQDGASLGGGSRRRNILLALGITAAVAALGCAAGLALLRPTAGRRG